MRFDNTVHEIVEDGDKLYLIFSKGEKYYVSQSFDHIAICIGRHFQPKYPEKNNPDSILLEGEIFHSAN